MTPSAAAEVASTIRSSFDWPTGAHIVAFREASPSVDEFAVLLPGASDEDIKVIEFCFKNGLVFEGANRPFRVVVFAEHEAPPVGDGWIEVPA